MPRLLLVASLACFMTVGGFLVIGLATAAIVAVGDHELAKMFLVVSLAIMLPVAPLLAGRLIPEGYGRLYNGGGYWPCCGCPLGPAPKSDEWCLTDFSA